MQLDLHPGAEAGATIPRSYLVAPFPQFTAVDLSYLVGGYEIYNSFQLRVNKRLSHGLSALISYTGQKQIDDYSGIQNVAVDLRSFAIHKEESGRN
jgi:hypothetical protein